eukprot:CAMPEP_0172445004 /NCGR_PEP_ID=MMETSP1065-20121228/5001_1 /TAXON_ID=265537 /ORGANISM="Amphiprora paludosa, Strain CCMP125" /LENGTH=415 /DNA_ID=CAMNT_0013195793 /DNA_START=21 /DNA_END=1268 /DNA_ORIENTATION=+
MATTTASRRRGVPDRTLCSSFDGEEDFMAKASQRIMLHRRKHEVSEPRTIKSSIKERQQAIENRLQSNRSKSVGALKSPDLSKLTAGPRKTNYRAKSNMHHMDKTVLTTPHSPTKNHSSYRTRSNTHLADAKQRDMLKSLAVSPTTTKATTAPPEEATETDLTETSTHVEAASLLDLMDAQSSEVLIAETEHPAHRHRNNHKSTTDHHSQESSSLEDSTDTVSEVQKFVEQDYDEDDLPKPSHRSASARTMKRYESTPKEEVKSKATAPKVQSKSARSLGDLQRQKEYQEMMDFARECQALREQMEQEAQEKYQKAAAEDRYDRLHKAQARLDAFKLCEYHRNMTPTRVASRRQEAYNVYLVTGKPSKANMQQWVQSTESSSSSITLDDIELLPWMAGDKKVDKAHMKKMGGIVH